MLFRKEVQLQTGDNWINCHIYSFLWSWIIFITVRWHVFIYLSCIDTLIFLSKFRQLSSSINLEQIGLFDGGSSDKILLFDIKVLPFLNDFVTIVSFGSVSLSFPVFEACCVLQIPFAQFKKGEKHPWKIVT